MQQKLEKRRGSFGAGLFASVALHVAIAALLLFRLPPAAPEPEKEETVKVEMVPEPEKKAEPEKKPEPEKKSEPEKKPEPEKKLEQKPEPRAKPQAEMKPMEKPATPAKAEPRPAEKRAEPRKNQPQAFESAANEGGEEAGGDTPSKLLPQPEVEPRADRAAPPVESKVTEKAEEEIRKPDDTPEASRPPELDLPETANAAQPLKGEAAIRMVPKPVSKPKQKPADATLANPEQSASADTKSTDAKPRRPPSELLEAKELFTADAFSNPRARQALGKLPPNRRIVQICTFEALEQIRHARPETLPEGIVAFSDGGGLISGQLLRATGGAFVSRRRWHDIEFECTVDEEFRSVTSFRFAVGKVVSESERKARGLPND